MKNESEVAWAAGLFEGEGSCVSLGGRQPCLALASTDFDVVKRFESIIGLGRIYGPETRGSNKPVWRWAAQSAPEVIRALRLLFPYLGARRTEQAKKIYHLAWQMVGRELLRGSKATSQGCLLSPSAKRTLAFALGEPSGWKPRKRVGA